MLILAIFSLAMTLLFGPLMFYVLSRKIKTSKDVYPSGITDLYGDLIFLPLYNFFFFFNIDFSALEFSQSIIISIILLILYIWLDLRSNYSDWSKTRNRYNLGGYYHLIFFWFQVFIISLGFLNYPGRIFLHLTLGGYFLTVFLNFLVKKHW